MVDREPALTNRELKILRGMIDNYEYGLRRAAWWNGILGRAIKMVTIASGIVVVVGGIITIVEHF